MGFVGKQYFQMGFLSIESVVLTMNDPLHFLSMVLSMSNLEFWSILGKCM
jgi:hypothetical protein